MNDIDMLKKELDAARMVHRQIAKLAAERDTGKALEQPLAAVGECVDAERVYVWVRATGPALNSYEWLADGVESGLDRFGKLTAADMEALAAAFQESECVVLPAEPMEVFAEEGMNDEQAARQSRLSDIFAWREGFSVAAAPIFMDGRLEGFIGADNVTEEMKELVCDILQTLGSFIGIMMHNNREQERLMQSYEIIRNTNDMRSTLVESVGSGIFAYTLPDREILMLNSEAKRLFDCPKDASGYDFMAMIKNKILPKDSVSMRKETILLKQPGDSAEYVFHIKKDSGERLTVKCNSQLRSFSNGQQYIISAMSDITEQERLERSLDEERRQYRDALNMNSYFSLAVDLTEGHITQVIASNDDIEIVGNRGQGMPMDYDEFMRYSVEQLKIVFSSKDSEKLLSRRKLIELFRGGVSLFDGESYSAVVGKYYRFMILMAESRESGHISASFVVNDITERKLEEEKNQSIIDSLSSIYHCVYYCNLKEAVCEVIKIQDKAEDRLSYDGSVRDFVRVYVSEYIELEFKAEVQEFLDIDTIDERFAQMDVRFIEYQRRKVGWCRGTLIVTERTENGGVGCVVFAVSVIEEQKKKELQAIHDLKQQWLITKSFSEIYFASWIVDFERNRIFPVTVPDFAKGVAEAGGGEIRPAFRYLLDNFVVGDSKEDMTEFLEADTLKARIEGKGIISCEYRGKVNGWCRANFIPVDDGSNRLIFAVQDIEEEKKKENEIEMALRQAFETARSANQAKTTFFANMSHDMRTPLNVIVGMTAVASSHTDDQERVKDCLEKIAISGRHLLRLINEVLDMSKIEAGQMELHEEEFSLHELVEELLVITKSQIEARRHEFVVSFHNIVHDGVMGDSQRIQQVFLNILGNAVKYTPDGGLIRLSVTETPIDPERVGQFEFVFEDNGIGMSEEFIQHLFNPFERADDARVNSTQGTGLGMPIAKNIVQMMNGTISVESKLDEGTKFTVVLRLKLQEGETVVSADDFGNSNADGREGMAGRASLEAGQTAAPAQLGTNQKDGKRRLLVAEDYDMNWEVVEMLLPDYGFDVERAENGQICVDMFTGTEIGYYDAILMDVRMPVKNGYEATVDIRKCGRADAGLPIIAMTADAFVEDVQACRDAGMNEHISKPLDMRKLLDILGKYLG